MDEIEKPKGFLPIHNSLPIEGVQTGAGDQFCKTWFGGIGKAENSIETEMPVMKKQYYLPRLKCLHRKNCDQQLMDVLMSYAI